MKSSFLKYFFFLVFFLLVFQGEGRGEVRVTEKIPIKTDIVSNFGAKIQANVDNILAAFPIDETHQFYQKLAGRTDEIHEAILDNIGDIGLRSVDDLTQFFDDIAAAGEELMEAFATNPNLIKAWDKLVANPSWRVNTYYLTKVSRYINYGLEIIEEGGELIVKQSDGVKVGKLDPNDVYDPGQMKVIGESSGRHFDPDEAGGIIVKKNWSNPTFNQFGIDDVSTHVARFTDSEALANNNFMINRLNEIKNGQRIPDDFDKRFYTHELEEYSRFQNLGVGNGPYTEANYLNAHSASLEAFSINENIVKIYPPNVPFPQYAGY